MKLFGFTISRTSKRMEDEKELEVFKRCVLTMKLVLSTVNTIFDAKPSIQVVQDITEFQEHVESLVEIYTDNKFSKPSQMFVLTTLLHDMRNIIISYTTHIQEYMRACDELHRLKSNDMNDEYGEIFVEHSIKATRAYLDDVKKNIAYDVKEYKILVRSIKFTITFDISRIESGVDIIKQYYKTDSYRIPNKGIEFGIAFKKLSRDEINLQCKSKEEKKNESDRV